MSASRIRSALLALLALLAACSPRAPALPAPEQIPVPDPSEVESVLFLVGDPGEARFESYPILTRLRQDIEWWAERLEADSAVNVLILGDIVYPLGLHAPGTPLFPHDSAIVMDQVELLAGPFARTRHAQGYFMAGNHDWGLEKEWEGFVRLKTLDDFLRRAQAHTGAHVRLVPEAGTGGPHVVDVGRHVRLLLLDTAWWLLGGGTMDPDRQPEILRRIERAMTSAGEREIVLAGHHPFRSAGPHGGEFSFWETLGVRYLLARSGAILQDLSSVPYREFEYGLRGIFARHEPPLIFAGGHEHSLQILAAKLPTDPVYSIVSGSASKLTGVGYEEGMRFGQSAPGYMRLLVEKDGGMSLFVESAPPRFRSCPKREPERGKCMAEGIAAFRTVHSQRIR